MSNAKDSSHSHAHLSDNKGHPVIDSLEQTRLAHHQEPFPHSHDDATTHIAHDTVVDEILNQEEKVPLDPRNLAVSPPPASSFPSYPSSVSDHNKGGNNQKNKPSAGGSGNKSQGDSGSRRKSTDGGSNNNSNYAKGSSAHLSSTSSTSSSGSDSKSKSPGQQGNGKPQEDSGDIIGLSTTATLPSATWQPLADKSSNQLPFKDAVHSGNKSSVHELEHDKPSVLPEIMPGFKGRMADIHHSTLKSVSGVSSESDSSSGSAEGVQRWGAGTMFPTVIPTGFKTAYSSVSTHRGHARSASEDATRALAKSSILYESSDLTESTTRLDDADDSSIAHPGASTRTGSSSTLVQGGTGGRRWSHELSPEKAGLAGSVLEVAGLIKDVVMDKIQQRPPSGTTGDSLFSNSSGEKEAAARVAFGGAEEAGDQNIYLEGFDRHMAHDAARSAAANAPTGAMDAEKVVGSALDAGLAGRSVFHQTANPEVMKSLLLNHPESLGYHARDPTLDPFEEQSANNTIAGNVPGPKDLSRMRR